MGILGYYDYTSKKAFASCSPLCFEDLLSEFEGEIFRLSLSLAGSLEEAESILSDVFCAAYNDLPANSQAKEVRQWLYQKTLAVWFDQRNSFVGTISSSIERETEICEYDDLNCGAFAHSDADFRCTLESGIRTLPYELRVIFLLADVDGFSTPEIGELINLDNKAVVEKLATARMLLCDYMQRFLNAKKAGLLNTVVSSTMQKDLPN